MRRRLAKKVLRSPEKYAPAQIARAQRRYPLPVGKGLIAALSEWFAVTHQALSDAITLYTYKI